MTRVEKIKKASDELFKTGSCGKTFRMGFEVGAMWADNNPKSPWISVDEDLPCNHPELIDNHYDNDITTIVLVCYKGNVEWSKGTPCYWMPIPEPPKSNI